MLNLMVIGGYVQMPRKILEKNWKSTRPTESHPVVVAVNISSDQDLPIHNKRNMKDDIQDIINENNKDNI